MSGAMRKACRLELNNSGAWKLLGTFDAADEMQTALVLDAAEELIKTLNNGGPAKRCPTLRVSIDEPLGEVLMRWDIENGWRDAATGDPV